MAHPVQGPLKQALGRPGLALHLATLTLSSPLRGLGATNWLGLGFMGFREVGLHYG